MSIITDVKQRLASIPEEGFALRERRLKKGWLLWWESAISVPSLSELGSNDYHTAIVYSALMESNCRSFGLEKRVMTGER